MKIDVPFKNLCISFSQKHVWCERSKICKFPRCASSFNGTLSIFEVFEDFVEASNKRGFQMLSKHGLVVVCYLDHCDKMGKFTNHQIDKRDSTVIASTGCLRTINTCDLNFSEYRNLVMEKINHSNPDIL